MVLKMQVGLLLCVDNKGQLGGQFLISLSNALTLLLSLLVLAYLNPEP